jgi:hypothetical protein
MVCSSLDVPAHPECVPRRSRFPVPTGNGPVRVRINHLKSFHKVRSHSRVPTEAGNAHKTHKLFMFSRSQRFPLRGGVLLGTHLPRGSHSKTWGGPL